MLIYCLHEDIKKGRQKMKLTKKFFMFSMNVLNELEWNILEMYLIYISTLSLLTDETQMCYVRNEIKI